MTSEETWQLIQKILIGSISFIVGAVIGTLLTM